MKTKKMKQELFKKHRIEITAICLDCGAKWESLDGYDLIEECEKCGAKYVEDSYASRIDHYCNYEDVKELLERL